MRRMMETVVEEGTGGLMRIDGYRVGGKTGTGQAAGKNQAYVIRLVLSHEPCRPVLSQSIIGMVPAHSTGLKYRESRRMSCVSANGSPRCGSLPH